MRVSMFSDVYYSKHNGTKVAANWSRAGFPAKMTARQTAWNLGNMKKTREPRIKHGPNTDCSRCSIRVSSVVAAHYRCIKYPEAGTPGSILGSVWVHCGSILGSLWVGCRCRPAPKAAGKQGKTLDVQHAKKMFRPRMPAMCIRKKKLENENVLSAEHPVHSIECHAKMKCIMRCITPTTFEAPSSTI